MGGAAELIGSARPAPEPTVSTRVGIVALGDVHRKILDAAASGVRATFGFSTAIAPALASPKYALNPSRNQHHAASILRKLWQGQTVRGRDLLLAIGNQDLFEPEADFIFGDGDRDFRSAVISLVRLRVADEGRLLRRVSALSAWAVGLSLGLRSCDDTRCAMAGIRSADELEHRHPALCSPCQLLQAAGGKI
ncbi:archaemetzincin [Vulgatibacter incomptus]|uniref:Uncharacterized protein n=1 Tax=Vulgatibacter incomptus TaxID=1391653 RepID=A0A0K1PH42_9BACT|nr:archaemetzincin [Vulgatibacter incomptus]AKU92840.1 hypothetical protein AKJ08_3227 [Vulgatibacter incomptus]